jgi:hypothetical protein
VAAAVATVALLAGGGITAVAVVGGSDGNSTASGEDTTPTDDPAPTAEPPNPSSTPVATGSWDEVPSDAEVNQVAEGLEANGYACHETAGPAMLNADEPVVVHGQPVLVRRCYLDPASGRDQEQTASLQAAPDGSVNAVRVVVEAFLDKSDRRTSRWFGAAVRGLTGTVLRASEARELVAGRTPDIAWGKADLYTNAKGTSYQLELIADGSDIQQIPSGTTRLSIRDVRAHYSAAGFACHDESQSVRCERTGRGYALVAIAADNPVRSLTLQAEFNAGMPEAAYTPIFDHLMTDGLPFAFQDVWSPEIDETLGAVDLKKAHRFDLGGLHVAFFPYTTASFTTDFDQAYQVVVEGICATDC